MKLTLEQQKVVKTLREWAESHNVGTPWLRVESAYDARSTLVIRDLNQAADKRTCVDVLYKDRDAFLLYLATQLSGVVEYAAQKGSKMEVVNTFIADSVSFTAALTYVPTERDTLQAHALMKNILVRTGNGATVRDFITFNTPDRADAFMQHCAAAVMRERGATYVPAFDANVQKLTAFIERTRATTLAAECVKDIVRIDGTDVRIQRQFTDAGWIDVIRDYAEALSTPICVRMSPSHVLTAIPRGIKTDDLVSTVRHILQGWNGDFAPPHKINNTAVMYVDRSTNQSFCFDFVTTPRADEAWVALTADKSDDNTLVANVAKLQKYLQRDSCNNTLIIAHYYMASSTVKFWAAGVESLRVSHDLEKFDGSVGDMCAKYANVVGVPVILKGAPVAVYLNEHTIGAGAWYDAVKVGKYLTNGSSSFSLIGGRMRDGALVTSIDGHEVEFHGTQAQVATVFAKCVMEVVQPYSAMPEYHGDGITAPAGIYDREGKPLSAAAPTLAQKLKSLLDKVDGVSDNIRVDVLRELLDAHKGE